MLKLSFKGLILKNKFSNLLSEQAAVFEAMFRKRDENQASVDQEFVCNFISKLHELNPKLTSVYFVCTQKLEFAFPKMINGVEFQFSSREYDQAVLSDEAKSKLIEMDLKLNDFLLIKNALATLRDTIPTAYFTKDYDEFGILKPVVNRALLFSITENGVSVNRD